ncbi:MAG: hypothetical protein JST00_01320 [Deltaproteobacteria bacterium]|nr:hypothetical protein [Deltaproteobacteria bacterium]
MVRLRTLLATALVLGSLAAGCTTILGSFEVGAGAADGGGGGGQDGGGTDGTTGPDAPVDPYSITVTKSGTGQGKVTSTPNAIDCGGICGAAFPPGTKVTLTATPVPPATFKGWGGACSGTAPCTLTVDRAHAVSAAFDLPSYKVKVTKTGSGRGTVRSTPVGIDCGAGCERDFDQGTNVKLVAVADLGSVFTGWRGACTGDRECDLTADAAKNVEAEFMAYATWDTVWSLPGTVAYSSSKLDISTVSTSTTNVRSSVGRSAGKFYWEIKATAGSSGMNGGGLGITDAIMPNNVGYIGIGGAGNASGMSFGYGGNAAYFMNWAGATLNGAPPGTSYVNAGMIYMFALDATAGLLWVGNDGTWYNGGDPGAGANAAVSGLTGTIHAGVTFYGSSTNKFTANFGQSAFVHAVPNGFAKGLY